MSAYDEFYASIEHDRQLQAHIDQRLARLAEVGNQATEPVSIYIEDGILECRAKSARHQARLLYCFQPRKSIVILLGVLKDQRRLDRADIEAAKTRKAIIEANAELLSGLRQKH